MEQLHKIEKSEFGKNLLSIYYKVKSVDMCTSCIPKETSSNHYAMHSIIHKCIIVAIMSGRAIFHGSNSLNQLSSYVTQGTCFLVTCMPEKSVRYARIPYDFLSLHFEDHVSPTKVETRAFY